MTERDYQITRYLNKPKTFLKLEYDEIFPAFGIFGVLFILGITPVYAFGLGFAWVVFLKAAKRGQGRGYLLTMIYWYAPGFIQKMFFPNSPSTDYTEWTY